MGTEQAQNWVFYKHENNRDVPVPVWECTLKAKFEPFYTRGGSKAEWQCLPFTVTGLVATENEQVRAEYRKTYVGYDGRQCLEDKSDGACNAALGCHGASLVEISKAPGKDDITCCSVPTSVDIDADPTP